MSSYSRLVRSVAIGVLTIVALSLHAQSPRRPAGADPAEVARPAEVPTLPQLKAGQLLPIEQVNPKVRAYIRKAREPRDSGGGPVSSFTVAGRTYRYTGTVVSRTTNFAPVAVLVAPPFEKIVRSYAAQAQLVIGGQPIPRKFRERNRYDDIVPVSFRPEQVYTSFGMGTSGSAATVVGQGVSTSITVGAKVGAEFFDIGLSTEVKAGVESAVEDEAGVETSIGCEVVGEMSGWNWTLCDLAKVFAVQAVYDSYAYAPDADAGRTLWINCPVYSAARLFGLDEWNAEAQRINRDKSVVVKVPEFTPRQRWWVGNVAAYPSYSSPFCMVSPSSGNSISGDDRLIFTSTQGNYIDREADCLRGRAQIDYKTWQSRAKIIGANSSFAAESEAVGSGVSVEVVCSIKQSYMHQVGAGTTFTMEYQTSGVSPLLDGGDGSIADFHFVALPQIYRAITLPAGSYARGADAMRRIARGVRMEATRKGTSLSADLARKLGVVSTQDITVSGQGQMAVAGFPLADLVMDHGLGVDGTSSILICQFATADLGRSYEHPGDHLAAWILMTRGNLLRKVAFAAIAAEGAGVAVSGQPVLIGWPPEITRATEPKMGPWLEDQVARWTDRARYRTSELRTQTNDWLDSLPQLSLEASRAADLSTEARQRMQDMSERLKRSEEQFTSVQLEASAGELLKSTQPGLYTLNPLILDISRPGKLSAGDMQLEASAARLTEPLQGILSSPTPRKINRPSHLARPAGRGGPVMHDLAPAKPETGRK